MKPARHAEFPGLVLARYFGTLKDPRIARTRRHPLLNLLVIAIAAVICGADGWDEIAEFGRSKAGWFATFLDLRRGTPSADTFRRVFTRLSPEAFAACFTRWVGALADAVPGEVIALDGKAVRGALDAVAETLPLHLVQAWATERRLVLGQRATTGGGTEAQTLPDLLAMIDVRDAVVTVDAIACRNDGVARAIVAGQGDYVIALKANGRQLFDHVTQFFDEARTIGFAGIPHTHAETIDAAHGRYEVRRIWAVEGVEWPIDEDAWPALRSVARVERERIVNGVTTRKTHYYVSSLPADATRLSEVIRARWSIENQLHWRLDIAFREDARTIKKGPGAENYALLCKVAINLLQRETTNKHGLPIKRKRAGWDEAYLLRVLTRGLTKV